MSVLPLKNINILPSYVYFKISNAFNTDNLTWFLSLIKSGFLGWYELIDLFKNISLIG